MAAAPDGAVLYPWAAGACCRGRGRRQATVESYRTGRALPLRCGWLNIKTPPVPDPIPRIEQQPAPDGGRLRVLGQWTAAQFARPRLLRSLEASVKAPPHTWDLSEAEQLDHVGAQWLWDH